MEYSLQQRFNWRAAKSFSVGFYIEHRSSNTAVTTRRRYGSTCWTEDEGGDAARFHMAGAFIECILSARDMNQGGVLRTRLTLPFAYGFPLRLPTRFALKGRPQLSAFAAGLVGADRATMARTLVCLKFADRQRARHWRGTGADAPRRETHDAAM